MNGSDQMKINNCNLHVEQYGIGNKQTIIFIHGAPGLGDCRADKSAFISLADTFHLIFLDMRGSGRSEEIPPYTHEQWTSDIEELRKTLKLGKIILHGGSYGGFLSMEYALRYPENVSHVLLRDTAPNNSYSDASNKRALDANLPGVTEELITTLFDGQVNTNEELKEMFHAILPLYTVEYNPEQGREKADNIFYHYETHNYAFNTNQLNYDVTEKLKSLSIPFLISVGRHDWITPVEASEQIAENVKNHKLIIYENSGHSPHVEENEQYLQEVRNFLKEEIENELG